MLAVPWFEPNVPKLIWIYATSTTSGPFSWDCKLAFIAEFECINNVIVTFIKGFGVCLLVCTDETSIKRPFFSLHPIFFLTCFFIGVAAEADPYFLIWITYKKLTSCGWAGPRSAKLELSWANLFVAGCIEIKANNITWPETVANQLHFMFKMSWLPKSPSTDIIMAKITFMGMWVGD